jgi:MFS family permease
MSSYALQNEVPDELRGRVFAVDMMIATLAISVSTLFVGSIVDHVNPRVPVAICGAITLTYAIVWRVWSSRLTRNEAPGASVVISPR